MGGLSIYHILVLLIIGVFLFYPAVRIVQRTGHSGWWCVMAIIPFGGIVGMWLLAFADWPALKREA